MQDIFTVIGMVVPEAVELIAERYAILRELAANQQRIGRKVLSDKLYISERTIRTAIQALCESALVEVNPQGILITESGRKVLLQLESSMTNKIEFLEMQQHLKQVLGVEHCWIVPGDLESNHLVYEFLGRAVQEILIRHLGTGSKVISVTGGTTLSQLGQYFTAELSNERHITFVPARGGVGGSFDIQSNSVGAVMARNAKADYLPLFIPERMAQQTAEALSVDPEIQRVVELSRQADCLIVSIGTAEVMAQRRGLDEDQIKHLKQSGAVGEAFGVFFDKDGQIIDRLPRIGVQIEELKEIPLLINVVAGASKAEAVKAYYKIASCRGWLICDESVAQQILKE